MLSFNHTAGSCVLLRHLSGNTKAQVPLCGALEGKNEEKLSTLLSLSLPTLFRSLPAKTFLIKKYWRPLVCGCSMVKERDALKIRLSGRKTPSLN